MSDQSHHENLRAAIRRYLDAEFSCGHSNLPNQCRAMLLADPPADGTKRERLAASLDATLDAHLPNVAERILGGGFRLSVSTRTKIQELLWAVRPWPNVPLRARREIAQGLSIDQLFRNGTAFMDLLDQFWDLDTDKIAELIGGSANGLRQQIERHVLLNVGDWSVEDLFTKLGAMEASDARFCHFIEALSSHQAQQDEKRQRDFVRVLNIHLRSCACELLETGTQSGYPLFTLVSTRLGPAGRPKNLIFASTVKPDLRLRDAINNDIEIVTHADKVLVYDRPIGRNGLSWSDLQAWWSESQGIQNQADAKRSLWERLLVSLPENSPPQRALFLAYYRGFRSFVPSLPALLPEVWLHWDPVSREKRGSHALPQHRMDFLLLLPDGSRIVIEVDGKQHFADQDGRASPERYSVMAAADRSLRLSGYEVFRFGATELLRPDSNGLVNNFFRQLLTIHGISLPARH